MTNEEKIIALEREIKELKERFDDLYEAVKIDRESSGEHVGHIYGMITELADYTMPAVHKVFPDIAAGQKEVLAFFKKRRPPASDATKSS